MKAETAFNVIDVLSEDEKKRLFEMLCIEEKQTKKQQNRISDTEVREMIITHFKRFSKRFKEKNRPRK